MQHHPTDFPTSERPTDLLRFAIDEHRHERIGGGDPGELPTYIARWLDDRGFILRQTAPSGAPERIVQDRHVARLRGVLQDLLDAVVADSLPPELAAAVSSAQRALVDGPRQ